MKNTDNAGTAKDSRYKMPFIISLIILIILLLLTALYFTVRLGVFDSSDSFADSALDSYENSGAVTSDLLVNTEKKQRGLKRNGIRDGSTARESREFF